MHPIDLFYDNPRAGKSRWGKSTWCKQGMKSRNKRLRYQKKRYDSPETFARREVQNALKRGEMVKPKQCQDLGLYSIECTDERLEFHHTGTPSRPDPYDLKNWRIGVWVCHQHHTIREGKSRLLLPPQQDDLLC
jgi:hypothetical protein